MFNGKVFDASPNPAKPGGIVPGTNPYRSNQDKWFRDWYIQDMYDPDIHDIEDVIAGKYIVPYEGELIKDVKNRKLYVVARVDSRYKSTLLEYEFVSSNGGDTDYNLFPKHQYGMLDAEFPLFIDYSVIPPVAKISANAFAADPAYAMVYDGNLVDPDNGGKVISAVYANNEFISNYIPVTPITPPGWNVENEVLKATSQFSVILPKEQLKNGHRCTLVFYDQEGFPIPRTYPLMVQHSQHLRDHKLGKRYIKGIELVSPWFTNSSTPNTLYIPINLPMSNVIFYARILYNDGTAELEPINGYDGVSGFTLHGPEQFKPTVVNQKGRMVLTYAMKPNEDAYMATPGLPGHISKTYELIATKPDGAYAPRIYTYPYWDPANRWRLKHYLTDLTRRFCIDVTDKVKLNRDSPAFVGSKYGEEQNLIFNLTLSDVSPTYESWTFVQYVNVVLYNDGTNANRKWDVGHSSTKPMFRNLELIYSVETNGTQKARFDGVTNQKEFLNSAYYAFDPMFDTLLEEKPIEPTHFTLIRNDNTSVTLPISSWNNVVLSNWQLINAETFYIAWVKREGNGNELQLGVSAAITRKVAKI